jgi:hypothetical protein
LLIEKVLVSYINSFFYDFFKIDTRIDGSEKLYYLFAERMLINDTSTDFINAIEQLFAVFFNFNMSYPEKATKTMIFIQRYFAEYSTTRTRADNMHCNKKSTVQVFMKKLNENSD